LKRVLPLPVCAGFFISKEEEGAYIFLMKQVPVPHTLILNKEISILFKKYSGDYLDIA
jgi:hypothetical protein